MGSFDPRSIILITFFVVSLQALILGALSGAARRHIAGLRFGAGAAGLWAAGAGLVTARGIASDFTSVYIGNLCLTGAVALMSGALRDLLVSRASSKTGVAVAMACYAAVLWLALASGSYHALLITITASNALGYLACVAVFWRGGTRGFSSRFLLASLAFACTVSAVRCATLVANVANPAQLYDTISFQRLYLGLVSLSIIAILLAYTLVVYDLARKLLERSNASLESEVQARTADLSMEIERKLELERQVSTTAEAERRRVGRELHDDLGQRLTGISLVAEALSAELSTASPRMAAHAGAIQSAASDAIAQVRRLAQGLMPVGPDAEDLGAALGALASATSLGSVACVFEDAESAVALHQDMATNLYRIAQEAVSNAIRHGGAKRVTISLDRDREGKTRLSVADNGVGFERLGSGACQGAGLGIIEFRASVIGFIADIRSTPGAGTVITVTER